MLDLEGKGNFLTTYINIWVTEFLFLFYHAYSVGQSEVKTPDKCYQALMSHIFFSLFKWGSTPDGKCCVGAGNCKARPDSGDTLLHKSLNKEQMPRDLLTNSVTLTVLALL